MVHKTHGHTHSHEAAPETTGRLIRWGASYDTFVNIMFLGHAQNFRNMAVDLAQVKPGEHVLEVGCGTGELTLAAQKRIGSTGKAAGIDPAPEMIEVARQKATQKSQNIDFQLGVIERLNFPDASFDVVLSSLMMHHLPEGVKEQGLAEIYRVLKPGGRLLVVDMKRPTSFLSHTLITAMMHHGLSKGVQDLSTQMEQAGFHHIETGNTPYIMIGFVRAEK